jgi:integrase
MSGPTPIRIPKYRRHKSGQARVTLEGKTHYLGKFGTAASKEAYNRLIQEWLARGRQLPQPAAQRTVNDLILAYVRGRQAGGGGPKEGEAYCQRHAFRVLRELYGRTRAQEFGPKALQVVRQAMVEKGWCRGYVNRQVDRVRRLFRWATSEELIGPEVYQALRAVPGLRRGAPGARESEPVRPVPEVFVEAARPFMPPPVRAMVDLQLLTGMRPGEVCIMRGMDLDMSGKVWTYRPGSDQGPYGTHKTAHRGKDRIVYLGPRAQEVVRAWLREDLIAYLFRPADALATRHAEARRNRKTPLYPSHVRRLAQGRKADRKRAPRPRYDVRTYRQAIVRACRKADGAARQRRPGGPADQVLVPQWHPNQLRHTAATNLRKEYGIELARIILGHATAFTTELYAEVDRKQAAAVVAKVG